MKGWIKYASISVGIYWLLIGLSWLYFLIAPTGQSLSVDFIYLLALPGTLILNIIPVAVIHLYLGHAWEDYLFSYIVASIIIILIVLLCRYINAKLDRSSSKYT